MIDEIFKVMKHFDGSYINSCGELIISDRGNVYFTATNCETKEDIICKLLEWCSRPIAKGMPYASKKKEISSGENLYFVAITIILVRILQKMICIGYMTSSEMQ